MTSHPPGHAPGAAPARRQQLLIPLAALLAVMPLIHHGCSCGHDFDFHLLNWMEAARQLSHGNLHPHWAFTPAFNAGEPRFVFYPPLSWYLGALLGLILTHLPGLTEAAAWSAAPILFTWIALTAAGLTLYQLARLYTAPNPALLAAILYLANPYMLFTAYERTAYAELLAAAWLPLLFHAILRDRVTIPRIALPIALLWLTNAPAAVMGCYTLAFLATLRTTTHPGAPFMRLHRMSGIPRRETLTVTLKILAGTTLGLALAAFYILPAEFERRFVQIAMATIAGMRIDQNFLFEHTGVSPDQLLHDQVLHTASTIAILLLVATVLALLASVRKHTRAPKLPTTSLAILTIVIAFLLTPLSLPIWNLTPQASFLQFPWRSLAILAPICALATAAALDRLSLKFLPTTLASLLIAIALSHAAYRVFRQPCDLEDTAPARVALFYSNTGTDPTDEYTPTTADNDSLATRNPPYWLAPSPSDPPPPNAVPGPAPMHLALTLPHPETLILNLRDYPAWRIARNDTPESPSDVRPDGLIAIPLPAGPSQIDITYTHTIDQTLGDATTYLALMISLACLRPSLRKRHSDPLWVRISVVD